MIPKINKKVKSFLMDESGKISKSNIIKAGLILAGTTTIKKVKSIPASGGGTGFGCGGDEIPGRCNHPTPQYLPGEETATWQCTKEHCKWTCTAEAEGRRSGFGYISNNPAACCPEKRHSSGSLRSGSGGHRNVGTATFNIHEANEHENALYFWHNRAERALKAKHDHHGFHGNWSLREECGPAEHDNHCSHGSHTSW
ncbi:MAG: hypothetical protein ACMXYG_07730 [Candidatus Woesearchaeota archaeon]